MIQIAIPEGMSGEKIAKRAFFLAYEACGGPTGLGFLRAVKDATEDDIWKNVTNAGDYPHGRLPSERAQQALQRGEAYGDYVFGRMMKLVIQWDDKNMTLGDNPRPDYQAWCRKYTPETLIISAIDSLDEDLR